MLDELIVENLGLIDSAHLEPGSGLVAVTGETGAGKTLLLGALRLLRGDAARTDRIGPSGDESRVEGRFLVDGAELVVARRVNSARSRAYLDGSMVPAGMLADKIGRLVEIVGQHEHLTIGSERVIRAMIDAGLGRKGLAAITSYEAAWERLTLLRADRNALGGDRRSLERERDLASHQAAEIDKGGLSLGEDHALSDSLGRLRHAEEIAEALAEVYDLVAADEGGAVDHLGHAARSIERLAGLDPLLRPLAERMTGLAAEAADCTVDLRREIDNLDRDPSALQRAEERMALIGDLKRRYGDSIGDIIEFGASQSARSREIETLLERADGLAAEVSAAEHALAVAGRNLREARGTTAATLGDGAEGHLRELGFSAPVVSIVVADAAPTASGSDHCSLLFASDSALDPGPVGRIASGGELSRLVLALRLAAGVGEAPVVAFDEIDAGIGGATALAMGAKLAALAEDRQVLVVTHLPQVAAFARTHIVVDRRGAVAEVRTVSGEDRREELARMLGGLPESERGRSHADELLAIAAKRG